MALITDILAYYKLDESSGDADNAEGTATYDLTNNGTTTYSSALINNGADFGTANTTKYLGGTSNLGITSWGGSYTFSCWVKLNAENDATYSNTTFLNHQPGGATGNRGLQIISYSYNNGTPELKFTRYHNNPEDPNTASYTITLGTTNWTHLVMTYNGTTITGYVNGTSETSVASDTAGGASSYSDAGFALGAYVGGGAYANAIVDEVGVWSRVLTTDEITELYNSGAGLQYPFTTTPTASPIAHILQMI